MCFSEPHEFLQLAKFTSPVAIAARRCDFCLGTIIAGERYDRVDGLYDGAWSNWSTCADCKALIERIKAAELSHGCSIQEATPWDADDLVGYLDDLSYAERAKMVGQHRKFSLLEERS